MGLDMYLVGVKSYSALKKEDGFPVSQKILTLGYWRKHPNLHGYIVQTFAKGEDECQEISLSLGDLKTILEAVTKDDLPHTQGFFFGVSSPCDKKPSIKILQAAIKWLSKEEPNVFKMVYYRASW